MEPIVSIIVPIYNAEQVLRRCVESVLKQDYENFELILVNDGSADSSGAICDEYAANDARVRVVHKANSGVSDTRNLAISMAKGEFLQFLDSDDWITPDATRLLVTAAQEHQSDMVIADFYRVVGTRVSHKGDIQENILLTREEFATYMMENPADFYYGVLWNKLYRRSIIETYGLKMDSDISWCEDFMFNMEYIRHVKSVYAIHVPIYYYVKTKGSLVSQGTSITKTIKMKRSVFEHYNRFYKDVFGEEDYEKSRMQVYRFLIDAANDGIVLPSILSGSIKLGNERIRISMDAMENEGLFMDAYREEKLLERHLETAALKNDLSLEEVKLIFYASQSQKACTAKEIAQIIHVSRSNLTIIMQKLNAKGFIKTKELDVVKKESKESTKKEGLKFELKLEKTEKVATPVTTSSVESKNPIEIKLLAKAEPLLSDLIMAQESFEKIKYNGFSEEELEHYEYLTRKLAGNIKNALK